MSRLLKSFLSVLLLVGLYSVPSEAKVVGEEVKYMVDGQELTGYLAYDDRTEAERPGILVVHEWWGHNPYVRKRAEMLAAMGYTAFALDMYGTGKLADHPKDAKGFMMETISKIEVAEKRFDAALKILKDSSVVDSSRTAAIGYCFGGGMVLHAARTGRDLNGVVSFHGSLKPMATPVPGSVKAQIRVFNGAADPFVKPADVAAFRTEMTTAGAAFDVVDYDGVVHSFTNPEADMFAEKFKMPVRYDAMADADSWAKTRAFFQDLFAK